MDKATRKTPKPTEDSGAREERKKFKQHLRSSKPERGMTAPAYIQGWNDCKKKAEEFLDGRVERIVKAPGGLRKNAKNKK